jgi:acyl carrier protein
MSDLAARLESCFAAVFPELKAGDLRTASTLSVAGWDSLRHITLLNVISEEFGVDVDYGDFAGATSFDSVLSMLGTVLAEGAAE